MTPSDKAKYVTALRSNLGGFPVEDGMADNLAIALCTYFSNHMLRPDPDPDTEHGWGEWVEQKTNAALILIASQIADVVEGWT